MSKCTFDMYKVSVHLIIFELCVMKKEEERKNEHSQNFHVFINKRLSQAQKVVQSILIRIFMFMFFSFCMGQSNL